MCRLTGFAVTLAAVLLSGCGGADRQGVQAAKAESERARLQHALEDERAKVTILQERLAAERLEHQTTRAEVNLWRERIRQLEQENDKLITLLEKQGRQAPERPRVAASPLPANIDQQLQAFAKRHSQRVTYDRGRAGVSFANDPLFASGNDQVRGDALPVIGELAGIAALLPAQEYEVIVVGHTDDTPISRTRDKYPSNWHLSVWRAIAVKNVLVSAGLPEARLGVMGYGPGRPLGEDRARNRRVEVFFVRRGEVKALPAIRVPPATAP
jgi:flagellar motor protein MotB